MPARNPNIDIDHVRKVQSLRANRYYRANDIEINRKKREKRRLAREAAATDSEHGSDYDPPEMEPDSDGRSPSPEPRPRRPRARRAVADSDSDSEQEPVGRQRKTKPQKYIDEPAVHPRDGIYTLPVITEILRRTKGGHNYFSSIKQVDRMYNLDNGGLVRLFDSNIVNKIDSMTQANGRPYAPNTLKQIVQSLIWITDPEHGNIQVPEDSRALLQTRFRLGKVDYTEAVAERQKTEAVPEWADYIAHVASRFGKKSPEMFIAQLYKTLPVRDDFKDLYIVDSMEGQTDARPNVILVPRTGAVRIVIREFKTAGKFNAVDEKLNKELSALARAFIKDNNLKPGQKLFKQGPSPIIRAMNSKMGYIPVHGGINFFRYMSAPKIGDDSMSSQELLALADRMLHSTDAQYKYRRLRLPADHWKHPPYAA